MQTITIRPLLVFLVSTAIGLAACQADEHKHTEPKPGTKVICRECYDEVTSVVRSYPGVTGSRSPMARTEKIRTHHCPSCKSDESIYVENGVLMVKCAACAPDGVACDKCLPPDGAK